MTKYLLTDIDDTIVSFNSTYIQYLQDSGHIELCPHTNDVLDVSVEFLNDAEKIVHEFQHSDHFANLQPFECAKVVLPIFKKHDYIVVGISAAQDSYSSMRNRNINMAKYFPNLFDGMYHVNHSKNKDSILKRFPKSIWVDDIYDNAKVGTECGHKSYYLTKDSNPLSPFEKVTTVKDWYTICEMELGFKP